MCTINVYIYIYIHAYVCIYIYIERERDITATTPRPQVYHVISYDTPIICFIIVQYVKCHITYYSI